MHILVSATQVTIFNRDRIIACVSRHRGNLIFTCCGALRQSRYRLQIGIPGSSDPRDHDWQGWAYILAVKNAWDIRRPRSKNNKNSKINCKFIFGSRLSCFPASAKKRSAAKQPRLYGPTAKHLKIWNYFLKLNSHCSILQFTLEIALLCFQWQFLIFICFHFR